MKTIQILVIVVITALAVVLVTASAYAYLWSVNSAVTANGLNSGVSGSYGAYPNGIGGYSGGMMGGNMGSMMGGNGGYQPGVQNAASPINLGFVVLIVGVIATVGTGSLTYYLANTRINIPKPVSETFVKIPSPNITTPYTSVSKTLTDEERKVLDVLVSHDGKYLQKYIRSETGLSRLKTHRIVARLAERGIINLEKTGNTNEVSLASWLKDSNGLKQNQGREPERR